MVTSAPALGLSQYDKPFTLFCHEQSGHAHGILTQEHGGKQKPLAYYSLHLDPVIRGAPTCIRAAAAMLKDKTADIVLGHPLTIQVPHTVTEILNQARTKHLCTARLTKYEVALLSPTNVTIKRCTVLNSATLLPQEDEGSKEGSADEYRHDTTSDMSSQESDEEQCEADTDKQHTQNLSPHDCMELMKLEMRELENVTDVPI